MILRTINIVFTLILFCSLCVHGQEWQKTYAQADTLYEKGQYKEAYPVFEKAEKLAESEFGSEHRNTVRTKHKIANILLLRGDYATAERKMVQLSGIFGRVAPTSVERAELTFYLGQTYRNQAKYAQADSTIREGLRIVTLLPSLTDRKRYRAYGLVNLANLYRVMGDDQRAKPLLVEALTVQDSLSGKVNIEYASYLSSLASVYDGLGEYTSAEPLYIEALAINRQLFGEGHPRLTIGLNNLGNLYLTLGDYAHAQPLLLKSLTIRNKTGATGQGYSEGNTKLSFLLPR